MRLHFAKINTSGNTTAIILNPLSRDIYHSIATAVMKTECLSVEQVGFMERAANSKALARLQMMGGEFCGNASRGLAAWLVMQNYSGIIFQKELQSWLVPIEASGHKGVLNAIVKQGYYQEHTNVEISMPIPLWIKQFSLKGIIGEHTIVNFKGILHVIVWNTTPSKKLVTKIKNFVIKELSDIKCLGIMFYNEGESYLTPVVYVKKVDSLVWENSCGSGTVAVAVALADKKRKGLDCLYISQPGGNIKVSVQWNDGVKEAKISGRVNIEAEGILYI